MAARTRRTVIAVAGGTGGGDVFDRHQRPRFPTNDEGWVAVDPVGTESADATDRGYQADTFSMQRIGAQNWLTRTNVINHGPFLKAEFRF